MSNRQARRAQNKGRGSKKETAAAELPSRFDLKADVAETLRQANGALINAKIELANARLNEAAALERAGVANKAVVDMVRTAIIELGIDPEDPSKRWHVDIEAGTVVRTN